ncbi:molybdopterin molybdotransferase MoeA [Methanospirillum stamsii]|uniref:Molybdopterin molybdenumtransferase MoeA n=1 Tax=Methanospirillum stamsii TaxID=1277351 RepID=A0A2V2MNA1_9EURY|nr:molybdopterin molybdotransferase MoeA [Methanospirillum stamsii]PWR69562.1 molybdopterin molybdenumtransferase MoeA [Methanospirillum stamsii]
MPRILPHEQLISMKEAQKIILSSFQYLPKSRNVPIHEAVGQILAESVISPRTMPPVHLAGPDGIAVRSEDTKAASPENPIEVQGIRVNTGLPMPAGYDAVIPVEEVEKVDDERFIIKGSVSSNQNMILAGTDVITGQTIVESGHYFTPYDAAALTSYGIRDISAKSWKVGIIPTGDEIIPSAKEPVPGQIVDTNSMMISGYLNRYGVLSEIYPITPDDPEKMSSKISTACKDCDMVILFGGSSAGSKDYTVDAIEKSGDLLFHGVAMGPGKPVSCGLVDGKPVFGMPGPSVSCLVTFYQLVLPLLKSWGVPIPPKKVVMGEITNDVLPFQGWDVFYLVQVKNNDGKIIINPVERRFGPKVGIQADAILHIPRGSDGCKKGERVQVSMIR